MKSYLPVIITSLLLLSASCGSSVAEIEAQKTVVETQKSDRITQSTTPQINPYIKDNIAPQISVKISSAENGGSGVIIAQQDNKYLVLTNRHVLRSQTDFTIETHDGESYSATEVEQAIESNDDLALLQFESDKTYQTATINTAAVPKAEQTILAVGYDAQTGELVTETGKIERVPDKKLKEGYSIGYTSNIVQGMSGGAIINTDGEVIGINGISAFPIVNTGYEGEDGTKPTREEVEQYRKLSWGIGINRLLARVNPELITAYNLPLPETTDSIETPPPRGWIGELEAKAKQITVRIDSSSGANGSGVIVAKEGNTYTVLTADHVLCEKDDERQCIDYIYEIVAPDGEKHTLDASTVKSEAGVDLATFRFASNESYQVAQLADYPIQNNNAVFVAGYPKLGKNTPPQWQFSLGYGLDKEQGLLQVNVSNSSSDQESSAVSQSILAGGYEMVYSSPTYGGMSGGAVLDKEGRVIGIHGQAEGETAIDSQGGALSKIQLGYSLGIPIGTFMGLKARLEVGEISPVGSNAPAELNSSEQETFETAILGTEIADSNATAKRWLERGNQLWRLQRYSEAAAAFERASELNETELNYLAYYGKGLALGNLEKYELALANLERATSSNPDFAPAFQTKSNVLHLLNQFDKALVAIDAAIVLEPKNANYYLVQAVILEDLQRLDEAVTAYDKAIETNRRATFYSNRGIVYRKQGEDELALSDYNQAIKLNPNDDSAYNNRGRLYQNKGEDELALSDYNQAIKLNSQDATAYTNRGNLYDEQGKTELALVDYQQSLQLNPNEALTYYNRGVLYQNQGEIELALSDYNQSLQLNPNLAISYVNRGFLYQGQGKTELALIDYNQAIKINPNLAEAYGNRGLLYQGQGKTELALIDYNQAIKINPNLAEAYYNRGLFFDQQKEAESALNDYNQAIKINSNHADAYLNRGAVYAEQGKTKLALTDYNQALKINPNLAVAYYNRGNLYAEQEKTELALADYNQALRINPSYADAYGNRGVLHQKQGETELALADYSQVIEINPNYAEVYYNQGLLYQQMGDTKTAISNLQKAQQLFIAQNNMAGAEQVASVLATLEQTLIQTAANIFSRKESIDPNDAQAYYDRAFEYHQQQEYDLALADYSQAIELDPDREKAYVNRGLVYYNQGKDEEAISDYNKAIEINPNNPNSYQNRGVVYFEREEYELAEAD